jgi:predicted HNH restriction endonuclease
VHHHRVHLARMDEGHETRLEDLKCLCSNCHRVYHRALTVGAPFELWRVRLRRARARIR